MRGWYDGGHEATVNHRAICGGHSLVGDAGVNQSPQRQPMELSAEQLRELVEAIQAQTGHDRRRFPRFSVRGTVMLVADPLRPGQPIAVAVRDVSNGGLSFTHHEGLRTGRQLAIRFTDGSGAPRMIGCEVKYCGCLGDNHFLIGVEFVSPVLPYAAPG